MHQQSAITSMSEVFDISIADFFYDLPPERIAPYPLEKRDHSKLLVFREGQPDTASFDQVAGFLEPGSLVVLNNTRVVQARLVFFKDSGARIEVFCIQPHAPRKDVQQALGLPSPVSWECLVGNAKKWKEGALVFHRMDGSLTLRAALGEKRGEAFLVNFSWDPPQRTFGQVLEAAGQTPLPPYIQRKAEASDKDRYQTVFARDEGSVAAPTAGLHFTSGVFETLARKNIHPAYVTLHVGAGTFKPVSASSIGKHDMHQEEFLVGRGLIEDLLVGGRDLISVGTTTMRTLESLYWIGVKLLNGYRPDHDLAQLEQWFPYSWSDNLPSVPEALRAILQWMDQRKTENLRGETALIIVPGYRFQLVDVLVTNFHQPRSTLLLLVAAFAGPSWRTAYRYAMENGFRFLSYGDACLFTRQQTGRVR